MQFIEKVSVESDSCSDHEVTSARLPFEILVLNPAQRYAARIMAFAAPTIFMGNPRSWANALAVPMGRTARATSVFASTWMMLWMVPSPPQAKTASYPSHTAWGVCSSAREGG